MPIWVLLVFCMTGEPDRCVTIDPDEAVIGLSQCALRGQELGALWEKEHPKWELHMVRCILGERPDLGQDT